MKCGANSHVFFGDRLGTRLVRKIGATRRTIPVFDVARCLFGGGFCFDMPPVGVVVRVKFAVRLTAHLAFRFCGAGGFATGVWRKLFAAQITVVVMVGIGALAEHITAGITCMILVYVCTVFRFYACRAAVHRAPAGMGAISVGYPLAPCVRGLRRCDAHRLMQQPLFAWVHGIIPH